jgi:two-component system chemotaxis response regulator CheY
MESSQAPSGSIFVVDDDPGVRDALSSVLQTAGYQVACAADGLEATDYLRSNPPPNLILLDLVMPRMNGWVFRIEQQKDPALSRIPVVVLSGRHDPAPAAGFLHAAGFLVKPVDTALLLDTVRRCCRASGG